MTSDNKGTEPDSIVVKVPVSAVPEFTEALRLHTVGDGHKENCGWDEGEPDPGYCPLCAIADVRLRTMEAFNRA